MRGDLRHVPPLLQQGGRLVSVERRAAARSVCTDQAQKTPRTRLVAPVSSLPASTGSWGRRSEGIHDLHPWTRYCQLCISYYASFMVYPQAILAHSDLTHRVIAVPACLNPEGALVRLTGLYRFLRSHHVLGNPLAALREPRPAPPVSPQRVRQRDAREHCAGSDGTRAAHRVASPLARNGSPADEEQRPPRRTCSALVKRRSAGRPHSERHVPGLPSAVPSAARMQVAAISMFPDKIGVVRTLDRNGWRRLHIRSARGPARHPARRVHSAALRL